MAIEGIFHVNVNCTDFERSLAPTNLSGSPWSSIWLGHRRLSTGEDWANTNLFEVQFA
jgi:hypothetical protein